MTMKSVSVHLPEASINGLKKLVETYQYPNMSEAIRDAIRKFLESAEYRFVPYM